MKKVFTTLCVAAITFTASNSVFAERNIQQIYERCGIGGLLFGNSNPTLAIISNVSFDLGTTAAISDGSDGCNVDSNETTAAIFIHESFDVLEADLAKGEGEYLTSLASIMQCEDRAISNATASVRDAFGKVVTSEDYSTMSAFEKSDALYQIVLPQLADEETLSCSTLS